MTHFESILIAFGIDRQLYQLKGHEGIVHFPRYAYPWSLVDGTHCSLAGVFWMHRVEYRGELVVEMTTDLAEVSFQLAQFLFAEEKVETARPHCPCAAVHFPPPNVQFSPATRQAAGGILPSLLRTPTRQTSRLPPQNSLRR